MTLPELWRQGEVRPTHAPKKGVWCEILDWLQQQPDAKAAELLDRLMAPIPTTTAGVSYERFSAGFASGES